jgi:hypothetical protein
VSARQQFRLPRILCKLRWTAERGVSQSNAVLVVSVRDVVTEPHLLEFSPNRILGGQTRRSHALRQKVARQHLGRRHIADVERKLTGRRPQSLGHLLERVREPCVRILTAVSGRLAPLLLLLECLD